MAKKEKAAPKLGLIEAPPFDDPAEAVAELLSSLLDSLEVREEESRDDSRRIVIELSPVIDHILKRFYRRTLPATPGHRHHEHLVDAIKAALPDLSEKEIRALLVDAHPAEALPGGVRKKLADPKFRAPDMGA